jgi:pimeloyl-ACP methyl ester carboxylesterase
VLATDDPGEVERMMATVLPLYSADPTWPDVSAALEEFNEDLKADLAAVKAWEGGLYQGIDLRPHLGRIRAPALVVAGELDLICGPAQAHLIMSALADGDLLLIRDCGHIPTIEAPERFRAAVVAWLEAD